jgi:hypothetical protein
MDANFSQSPDITRMGLASRICPFGEYWFSTGAALPVGVSDDLEATFQQIRQGGLNWPSHLRDSLLIVRAFLAGGAAKHIRYEDALPTSKGRVRTMSGTTDPTDLCPCRSGLMYKYCCGRVKGVPASS